MSISTRLTRKCRDIIQVRWKTFKDFAENLFRKLCTKFNHNRPSSVENISNKYFGLFLLETVYFNTCISEYMQVGSWLQDDGDQCWVQLWDAAFRTSTANYGRDSTTSGGCCGSELARMGAWNLWLLRWPRRMYVRSVNNYCSSLI